jgi:hypothetical protein
VFFVRDPSSPFSYSRLVDSSKLSTQENPDARAVAINPDKPPRPPNEWMSAPRGTRRKAEEAARVIRGRPTEQDEAVGIVTGLCKRNHPNDPLRNRENLLDKQAFSRENVSMRPLPSLLASALGFALLAACASEQEQAPSPSATSYCEESPGSDVYAEAFTQYMAGLSPTPRRFLSAAGTDSALPEPVFEAVQDKGPTYFYPGDEAGRKVVRQKLIDAGPWASLLVVHKGNEKQSDSTVAIRLGGHYVGGKEDGMAAPVKSLIFACDTMPWRFVRSITDSAAVDSTS